MSRMMMESALERFEGCLLGLAVGDALGAPLEFLTREKITAAYGERITGYVPALPSHANAGLAPGQFTDDTQLSLELAASLIAEGEFDEADFAGRLVALHRGKTLRSAGRATKEACRALANGISPKESGVPGAMGCGSAMRAAPLGLFYRMGQEGGRLFASACVRSTLMTHKDPRAVAGTAAIARGVMHLKRAERLDSGVFLREVIAFAGFLESGGEEAEAMSEHGQALTSRLEKLNDLSGLAFEKGVRELGTGGSVLEAVPLAFLAFLKWPDDFETAVTVAASCGGDADTIASMAGALSGAYNGIEGIPARLLEGVEDHERIKALAGRLFDAYRSRGS